MRKLHLEDGRCACLYKSTIRPYLQYFISILLLLNASWICGYYPKFEGLEIESYREVSIPQQAVKFTRSSDNLLHFFTIFSGSFKDVFYQQCSFYRTAILWDSLYAWYFPLADDPSCFNLELWRNFYLGTHLNQFFCMVHFWLFFFFGKAFVIFGQPCIKWIQFCTKGHFYWASFFWLHKDLPESKLVESNARRWIARTDWCFSRLSKFGVTCHKKGVQTYLI